MATKQFSIRLDSDIAQRLAVLARRTGRSRSFYVKEAILDHLEHTALGEQGREEFRRSARIRFHWRKRHRNRSADWTTRRGDGSGHSSRSDSPASTIPVRLEAR